jgi:hypothetical protein
MPNLARLDDDILEITVPETQTAVGIEHNEVWWGGVERLLNKSLRKLPVIEPSGGKSAADMDGYNVVRLHDVVAVSHPFEGTKLQKRYQCVFMAFTGLASATSTRRLLTNICTTADVLFTQYLNDMPKFLDRWGMPDAPLNRGKLRDDFRHRYAEHVLRATKRGKFLFVPSGSLVNSAHTLHTTRYTESI